MNHAEEYIEQLQLNGKLTFTTNDAVEALNKSVPAVRAQLRRLKAKRHIAAPIRSFHVIVPPKYRRLECLPPDQFIRQLMSQLGEPYYVGLLSAAAYYGAAHQAPMTFQVMVRESRRDITCGGVRIAFIARRDMQDSQVVERQTPTGTIRVASPATTALELVGYPEHCGYLDNVATVLAELVESIDEESLVAEAQRAPNAWVQRLGYILTVLDEHSLAAHLADVLKENDIYTVPLAPWQDMTATPRSAEWNVAINTELEPDL